MAEALAAIGAWWAALGYGSAAAATAAGASAGGTAAVGAGTLALAETGVMGAAAAGSLGASAATGIGSTLLTGAGVVAEAAIPTVAAGLASKVLAGDPKKISTPPVAESVDVPLAKKKAKDPGNVPGSQNKNFGAGAAAEKRRLMASMPSPTQNVFAGDRAGDAVVKKKRLLGGGTYGRETTGA